MKIELEKLKSLNEVLEMQLKEAQVALFLACDKDMSKLNKCKEKAWNILKGKDK